MRRIFFISLAFTILAISAGWSDIPQTISYQGILTDSSGSPVSDGFYELTFRIYESETGAAEWSETHSLVEVNGGVFSVILGTVNPVGNPLNLPFDKQCWLGVQIGSEPELSPKIALTAVPYSLNARSVADGSVTSSKIPSGQVVKSVNGLKDDVNLAEGDNISIEKSGDTLTISAASGSDDAWKLAGNSGTEPHNFLGTSDDKPLEIRVYNLRVFRLEPNTNSPNIIGGGGANYAYLGVYGATICGGGRTIFPNRVTDIYGIVGGGYGNQAGNGDNAYGVYSTVGGGSGNGAADYAIVGGGEGNEAEGSFSTIAGGGRSVPTNPATGNRVYDDYGTIGGGGDNQAGNDDSNLTTATYATISGGKSNEASDDYATAGGGMGNKATNDYSTIAGGKGNKTQGWGACAGGGEDNSASGSRAAVSGGHLNVASGDFSAVPGGENNTAQGNYSFAAGRRAKASNDGAFVWADSQDYDFASTLPDEFSVRCTGGARFVSSIDDSGDPVTGVKLESDGTGWSNICDRDVKENFARVDTANVLQSLMSVPIETWNAKGQDPPIRHIGPMAQDFYRAFGLGEDNRYICTVDADGVALAAIQGLYKLLRERDEGIAELEARIRKLEERIASLQK